MPHRDATGLRVTPRPWAVMIAAGRAVAGSVFRAATHARAERIAVERELFGGLYIYSSKNDDDLPAVSLAVRGRSHSAP